MKSETLKALAFIAAGITAALLIGTLVWRFSIPAEPTRLSLDSAAESTQRSAMAADTGSSSQRPAADDGEHTHPEPHATGTPTTGHRTDEGSHNRADDVAGFIDRRRAGGTTADPDSPAEALGPGYTTRTDAEPTRVYRPNNLTVPDKTSTTESAPTITAPMSDETDSGQRPQQGPSEPAPAPQPSASPEPEIPGLPASIPGIPALPLPTPEPEPSAQPSPEPAADGAAEANSPADAPAATTTATNTPAPATATPTAAPTAAGAGVPSPQPAAAETTNAPTPEPVSPAAVPGPAPASALPPLPVLGQLLGRH